MYKRTEHETGGFAVVRIKNERGCFFDVIPSLGAMVYRIGLSGKDDHVQDILRFDSPDKLDENTHFRGRVLFPFNDRIPEGRYSFKGKEYRFPINEVSDCSSIHGLVYDKQFVEKESHLTEESGSITFAYNIHSGDWDYYPFSSSLDVTYKLSDEGFGIYYVFSNDGNETMPVALGWHPYFNLRGQVDTWKLRCGGGRYVAVDDSLNPTGEILSVEGEAFDFRELKKIGKEELDLAFTAQSRGQTILEDENYRLSLYFDPRLFSYCQLYIPGERDSIAIEPVTAATNAFNIDGLGRIDLKAGESMKGSVKISLNSL